MERSTAGWGSGLLGVLIFSGSLPATRVAVGGFTPLFLTAARAVIAAALAAALLALLRQVRPARRDLPSLAIVALGVVAGFPLLTALALQHITSAQSVVFIGLLPLSTALFGVLRGRERPRPAFWLFATGGSLTVAGFALWQGGGASPAGDLLAGDLLMVLAILLCGLGYAEGAALSRRLGGWQVISWALVLALPAMAVAAVATMPEDWAGIGAAAWAGLGYVSVFSMLIGFFFWYRGLALGGIAGVGQLQLLQPAFGLILAGLLLREPVAWTMIAATGLVVLCVAGAKRFA
ncbi:DMT family transporter [Azospirillum sp. 412522]|nr:DMT family transporter [Azospirillum sp. 412522]MBY6261247.1 DMT family transporter [Azospirillum sp. 412522]